MIKKIAIWVFGILCLFVVLVIGAIIWFVHATQQHLMPPSDPLNQKSIASYAAPESLGPLTPPELVEDFAWDSIVNPPKSSRPWTRWWWPGADVDAKTLLAQIDVLDAAQFGGGEIQASAMGMDAVKDKAVLDRVYRFGSPTYYETLNTVLKGAATRGWQLDLTHLSGWPPGGPEINLDDSMTEIVYSETEISGGKPISIVLPKPKPGVNEYFLSTLEFFLGDFINFPVEHARIISVLAAKKINGQHSPNPFNLKDTETLDPTSIKILTESVENGVLNWNAPPGDWTIITSFIMPSGEAPINGAQKPTGFVVDHLRKLQVLGHYEYAFGARTGLQNEYGKGLRGIFNDSLEFRLKRMSVEDILREFKARRGYDLEPYLPAIYVEGIDNLYIHDVFGIHAAPEFQLTAFDARIRYDYQRTLSDLLIERFVETSAQWAESHGLTSRAQSYGVDIDILRALGANTIPETEQLWAGGSDLVLKMAPSAAALYGKPLASAESFVWRGRDYTSTARKIKAAADKEMLAGINHIIYHGTPAPWRGGEPSPFGEEGWTPFSGPQNQGHFSSIVSPANTQLWPDIAFLNTYIARSQNLLRQGSPSVDVLIYYPFLGFSGIGEAGDNHEEFLLGGSLADANSKQQSPDPLMQMKSVFQRLATGLTDEKDTRGEWLRNIVPFVQELDRRGITWAWVNADAIETGKVGIGTLPASKGHYQSLVLPNVSAIDQSTLLSLTQLAQSGASIYFAGTLPTQQLGFRGAEQGDREVQMLVQQTLASGAKQFPIDNVQLADALQKTLRQPLRYEAASAIKYYRRELGDGKFIYFFSNQSTEAAALKLHIQLPQPLWWFDAMQGVAWPVKDEANNLDLQLGASASRFLISGVPMPATLTSQTANDVLFQRAEKKWPLTAWRFSGDGVTQAFNELSDWRAIPALAHVRGPGSYSHLFKLDNKVEGARYLLSLGLVQGSASVKINGKEVGRASIPPFIVDVSSTLRQGDNVIDVQVLAPLRNYFVGRALDKDPKHSNFENFANQLVAAGLMGPVTIAEAPPN